MQLMGVDHLEGQVAENPDSRVAANSKVRITAAREYPWLHITVVEPWHHRYGKCHLALDALDDTNQLAPWPAASPSSHREEISDPGEVAALPVRGLKDE